ARLSRHAGGLARLLSLLRSVPVCLWRQAEGHGDGGLLLRAVDRLLERLLRGAGSRLSRLSGRGTLDGPAHRRTAELSDHRARLPAVLRAVSRRGRGEEGRRPREGHARPYHLAHG